MPADDDPDSEGADDATAYHSGSTSSKFSVSRIAAAAAATLPSTSPELLPPPPPTEPPGMSSDEPPSPPPAPAHCAPSRPRLPPNSKSALMIWSDVLRTTVGSAGVDFDRCRRFWNHTCTCRAVRPRWLPNRSRSAASGSFSIA